MTHLRIAKSFSRIFTILIIVTGLPILACFRFDEIPDQYRETVENPDIEFTQLTDLEWPKNTRVITVADTHGGFFGDGEFYLVFDSDQEILEEWLSNTPPWEVDKWKSGPVPPEIGAKASFGTEGVGTSSANGGPTEYWGDEQLIQLLNSDSILYAAKERCCGPESLYFHNGNLLIIDLEAQMVWLSVWDY